MIQINKTVISPSLYALHNKLITYIQGRIGRELTGSEVSSVSEAFVHKKLRRNQYLLQEGDVCRFAGFIVRGALKQYVVDETGKENVLGLLIENWWAGDRESFMTGKPSYYAIQAVEDTDLLLLTRSSFTDELAQQDFMADLMRGLTEKQALQLMKRVHTMKSMTAEQRLADLEQNYPEFLQRFPQHLIASYLGMTKETLSRIRASQARK